MTNDSPLDRTHVIRQTDAKIGRADTKEDVYQFKEKNEKFEIHTATVMITLPPSTKQNQFFFVIDHCGASLWTRISSY